MLIFAMLLLAFTGSGLHKAAKVAAKDATPVIATAFSLSDIAAQEACCADKQETQKFAHCIVHWATLADTELAFAPSAPLRFGLPGDWHLQGLSGDGLEKPPRTRI